jgi:hypothetical protein
MWGRSWRPRKRKTSSREPRQALSSGTGGELSADDIEPASINLLTKSLLAFHPFLPFLATTPQHHTLYTRNHHYSKRKHNHGPHSPLIRPPTRRPLPLPPLPPRRPPQAHSKPAQLRGLCAAGIRSLHILGQERLWSDRIPAAKRAEATGSLRGAWYQEYRWLI